MGLCLRRTTVLRRPASTHVVGAACAWWSCPTWLARQPTTRLPACPPARPPAGATPAVCNVFKKKFFCLSGSQVGQVRRPVFSKRAAVSHTPRNKPSKPQQPVKKEAKKGGRKGRKVTNRGLGAHHVGQRGPDCVAGSWHAWRALLLHPRHPTRVFILLLNRR